MRKTILNAAQTAFLTETFARNRALFGGWSMEETAEEKAAREAAEAKAAEEAAKNKFEAINSQEEFDRRLSARLNREREKFADYDDLKAKAEAHDKAVEDAKTESQKAIDAARKEGETTARSAADVRIVRAEAKAALATANAKNPDSAVKLLSLDGVKVGEDGEVDADALKAKIDALKESDDYLFSDGKPATKTALKPDKSQGGGKGDGATGIARGRELFTERRGSKHKAS